MTGTEEKVAVRLPNWLDWLDNVGFKPRGLGLMHDIRIEDFVEEQTYVVRAEIPGIDPAKDVDIHVEGDMLTVKGQRREEKREKGHQEMAYGSFERSVRLPGGVKVDEISAKYDDGILEVRAPFHAEAPQARRIQVPVQREAIGGLIMHAMPGDRLVIHSQHVDEPERDAEVLEVKHPDGSPPYLVRWSDTGHEALVFPGPDAYVEHGSSRAD